MAELSVRYANALYSLSMERGLFDEYLEQAYFLRDTLADDKFLSIIKHPAISGGEKRDFLKEAFAGKIHDDLLGFLYLTIAKSRESFLLPAITAFIGIAERRKGKTTANVVSAAELSESQISALKDLLSKKLNKHVEITSKVDSSLLGGISIHVDGYLIDRTVVKQLSDMKDTIKRSTPNDFQA